MSDASAEVPEQLRRQFTDGSVWHDKDSVHPHDGLLRALIPHGPFRDAVVRQLPGLLASPELRHRTGAVALLPELGAELGADTMASCATEGEAGLRGVRPAWLLEQDDLEACVAIAIAKVARPADRAALAYLRRVAVERPWRLYVLHALARLEPEWLVTNAKGLVTHQHLGLFDVLDPAFQERLVDALSPYPREEETFFTKAFWRRQPPATAARLRARMWPPIVLSPPPRIDFAARELDVKLVYCGAAFSGRSASLACVQAGLEEHLRTQVIARVGEQRDVRTGFTYLPGRVVHGQLKVRVELSTIPSARFRGPETLVPLLDGAHGIVYVLDSDPTRREAALAYRALLDAELARHGLSLSQVPHVWQLNKRDLPDALPVGEASRGVVTDDAPVIETSARPGEQGPRTAVDELLDRVLRAHGLLGDG